MRHADIIDRLGIERTATATGRHHSTVRRWRQAGIPAALWPTFVDRLGVSFDALRAGASDRAPVPPLRRGPKPRQVAA